MNFCTECGRRFFGPEDHFCIYCVAARAAAGEQQQQPNPMAETPKLEPEPLSAPPAVGTDGTAGRDSWLVPIGANVGLFIWGVAGSAIWGSREPHSTTWITSNGPSPTSVAPTTSEAQSTPSESAAQDPSVLACRQSLPNNRTLRAGDSGNAVRAPNGVSRRSSTRHMEDLVNSSPTRARSTNRQSKRCAAFSRTTVSLWTVLSMNRRGAKSTINSELGGQCMLADCRHTLQSARPDDQSTSGSQQ